MNLPFDGSIRGHLGSTNPSAIASTQHRCKSRHSIGRGEHGTVVTTARTAATAVTTSAATGCDHCATNSVDGRVHLSRNLDELRNLVHLLLSRLATTLCQPLLGSHATDVIVEQELSREQRSAVVSDSAPVHGDVQAARVILITLHLYVLQKANELCHAPAKQLCIRLDEN